MIRCGMQLTSVQIKVIFLVGNSSDSWSNGALAIALNLSYPKFSATVRAMCPHLPLGYLGEYRTKFAAKIEFSFFIFSLSWIIKQPFIKLATRLDVGDNFPLVQVVTHYVFSKRKKTTRWPFLEAPWDRESHVLPKKLTKKYIDNQPSLTIFFCGGTLLTPYLVKSYRKKKSK